MARLPAGRRGRKRELKKIENERERAISFTKRRGGIFKKASELATLCGIQIAVFVFSLKGKTFSFGSPNVPFIIKKFLNSNQAEQQPDDSITRFDNSCNESTLQKLNQEFDELHEQLSNEKKRGQMLQESFKAATGWDSYDEYIGSLGIHELMQVRCKLDEMSRRLERNGDDISGPSSSNNITEADLSKIGAQEDYLKLG